MVTCTTYICSLPFFVYAHKSHFFYHHSHRTMFLRRDTSIADLSTLTSVEMDKRYQRTLADCLDQYWLTFCGSIDIVSVDGGCYFLYGKFFVFTKVSPDRRELFVSTVVFNGKRANLDEERKERLQHEQAMLSSIFQGTNSSLLLRGNAQNEVVLWQSAPIALLTNESMFGSFFDDYLQAADYAHWQLKKAARGSRPRLQRFRFFFPTRKAIK